MTPCHAAALALVGWYLMYPPFKKNRYGHYRADPTVPLTEWNFYPKYSEPDEKLEVDEEEFFDRAHALEFRTYDECEHLRKHFYEEWYGTKGHPGIKGPICKRTSCYKGHGGCRCYRFTTLFEVPRQRRSEAQGKLKLRHSQFQIQTLEAIKTVPN